MGGAVLADAVVLAAPPFRPDRTTTLGGKEKRRRAPSVAPWDDMPEEDLGLAASPVMRANGRIHGFRHEQFAGDAAYSTDTAVKGIPGVNCLVAGVVRLWSECFSSAVLSSGVRHLSFASSVVFDVACSASDLARACRPVAPGAPG